MGAVYNTDDDTHERPPHLAPPMPTGMSLGRTNDLFDVVLAEAGASALQGAATTVDRCCACFFAPARARRGPQLRAAQH
jgi:hypothetical protein